MESNASSDLSECGKYVSHKRKSEDPESAWFYFLQNSQNEMAKCKKCQAVIKTKGGSTKGLWTHLKTRHNITSKSSDTGQTTEAGSSNQMQQHQNLSCVEKRNKQK